MVEPEKWVSDKPSNRYNPKPAVEDRSQFPSLAPAPATTATTTPCMDFSVLGYASDDEAPVASPEDETMINLRNYLKKRKQAGKDEDEDEDDGEYEYYLHYNMFMTVEDMMARWNHHHLLSGTSMNYTPDEDGLDTWDSASESEDSDDGYDEEY